ncbi:MULTISPECIES: B12-binding domain-containing protein [unclassified Methanoregula]|uniref:cobalamin B12-binding domain-containing protein n=1 Tax=unclassified Methanoregula TaxID=2649730 RepID=UPI0009CA4456|nr:MULTISPECIES: cobalamin-dependent protein [unclassified Methanoregula]OPX62049.1 MAG: Trimethylamine corrinoid protein [Methanoregula sp. PtaB.Bin085]OPY36574.1 MAG: Trimethylamine corrinoid protein [Methanoregula sp. PtaU1.Bin006]
MTAKKTASYRPVSLNREFLAGNILETLARRERKAWELLSMERRVEVREVSLSAITALEESLAIRSPVFLEEAARWTQVRFAALHYPQGFAAAFISCLAEVISRDLPGDYRKEAAAYAKSAAAALRSAARNAGLGKKQESLSPAARAFIRAGLSGDLPGCRAVIKKALAAKKPVAEIYTRIFIPVLYETGRLWQAGDATIAQEHFISAIVRQSMDRLHEHVADASRRTRQNKSVVAACVGEELHDIGIRMVGDFFEMDGWDVYFLGANTPPKSILAAVREQEPDVLALSVTMPSRLRDAEYLIRSLRASPDTAKVKIIVGGSPFRILPDLGKRIGADAVTGSAEDAVPVARKLLRMKAVGKKE